MARRRRQDRPSIVGQTRIDGRGLSTPELRLLNNPGYVITYAARVPMMTRYSDARVQAAFRQVVNTSALLQSVIKDDEDVYKRQPSQCWPTVKILSPTPSSAGGREIANATHKKCFADKEAHEKMRAYTTQQMELIRDGERKERLQQIRTVFVRGEKYSYIGLAAPHQYFDGIGVAVVLIKFLFYAKFPRIFWPILDRFSPDQEFVPTFMEMAFKGDLSTLEEVDGSLSKMGDPTNFKFLHFQPGDDMYGYSKVLGFHTDPKIMEDCRIALRREKVTISSIFDALAVKILAQLLEDDVPFNPDRNPLLVLSPVDGRKLGTWGDARDKFKGFPTVAEYSFFTTTQVPFETALSDSLVSIASLVRGNVTRTCHDKVFRMHQIQGISHVHVLCGTSCPQLDKGTLRLMQLAGIKPFEAVPLPKKVFKPTVWLLCGTIYPKTTIAADIHLPIPGLSDVYVREVIAKCVKDSPVESLFNM